MFVMNDMFDCVVIGGGAAGLSATLTLARANRKVLLLDGGAKRNDASSHIHNLLGHDGMERAAFYAQAHAQLEAYDNLYHWDLMAEYVMPKPGGFIIRVEGDEEVEAPTIVLATGLRDVLPGVPGLDALWGTRVLHCAYCHGYEVRGRRIGLYAKPKDIYAMLEANLNISDDIVVFFDEHVPDEAMRATLERLGIAHYSQFVERLDETADGVAVVLEGGERVDVAALFIKPGREQRSGLPDLIGCQRYPSSEIMIDVWGRTSVAGVYAAGDAAGSYAQLASSISSALHAAVAVNIDLNHRLIAG